VRRVRRQSRGIEMWQIAALTAVTLVLVIEVGWIGWA
jgi:hypothetical protein